jgi:hypothetical protein
MADIDIVPKTRAGLTWLWILLAIVAALVIMWMIMGPSAQPTTGGAAARPDVAMAGQSTLRTLS